MPPHSDLAQACVALHQQGHRTGSPNHASVSPCHPDGQPPLSVGPARSCARVPGAIRPIGRVDSLRRRDHASGRRGSPPDRHHSAPDRDHGPPGYRDLCPLWPRRFVPSGATMRRIPATARWTSTLVRRADTTTRLHSLATPSRRPAVRPKGTGHAPRGCHWSGLSSAHIGRLEAARLWMGARNRRTSILDLRIVLPLRVNPLRFVEKALALAAIPQGTRRKFRDDASEMFDPWTL